MTKRTFVRELSGEYKLVGEKERLWNANRVMHGDSLLHKGGPQMWNKRLIDPADGLTQTIHSHVETIAPGGNPCNSIHQK